ncbi:MAG: hypothetical protein IT320_00875 [Anaerolineae bacterium]|nr:hypothetical protein [Anaerolineae bacterium]
MPSASIFRWRDGRGWLVLAPGTMDDPDVRALVAARASADGSLAVAVLDGDLTAGDRRLEDFEELGATSGYLVDILTEDDETIATRLAETSIVLLESGADLRSLKSSLMGAALQGLQTAFANGAYVLAAGAPAMLFGEWAYDGQDNLIEGFGWLQDAVVMPVAQDLSAHVKSVLQTYPELFSIGIGERTALALGPDGQVEIWGQRQIGVALGQNYAVR